MQMREVESKLTKKKGIIGVDQDGKLSPIKYKKYNSNDEALQFYVNNKQKLRGEDLFIELVTLKEEKQIEI